MKFPVKYLLNCIFALKLLSSVLIVSAQSQLTNLPTFYINTENSTPVSSTDVYVNAKLTIVSSNPAECIKDSAVQIRGRGNSTWTSMAKKSYRIKFPDNTRILSMPAKENSWVMLANYADKTLIRNAVAFEVGRALNMKYTPPVRYADVYLNNDFIGNYLVTDQLSVDKNRVNVEKTDSTVTTLPNISGGYLLEINGVVDPRDDPYYVKTNKGLNVIVKYPDDDDINAAQFSYISDFVKKFESTLFSSNYADPSTGYRSMVDTTELVNWYLACELTGNPDSFWSTYWYKKRSVDQVIFGPLWDNDIAFNNDKRLGDATKKLMRNAAFDPKAWITQFSSDSWFLKKVYRRYLDMKSSGLLDKLLTFVDDAAVNLDASQQQNFKRWDILNKIVYNELAARGTYSAEINFLKNYLINRFAYLDIQLIVKEQPVYTSVIDPGFFYSIINKKTNKAIDVSNGSISLNSLAVLFTYDENSLSQQWKFIQTATGVYYIENRNSGWVLQNDGKNGSQLFLTKNTNSQFQQWKVVAVDSPFVGIQNVLTNQYSINNKGGSISDNNPIIEYTNNINGSDNQQWTFVKHDRISTTAINELNVDNYSLWVYPNPATNHVNIYCHLESNQEIYFNIYSVDGKCVFKKKSYSDTGDVLLNLDNLQEIFTRGLYLIQLESHGRVLATSKLVIR